jgi:hypothetical protein
LNCPLTDALNGVGSGVRTAHGIQPPHPVDYHAYGLDEALVVAPDASAPDGAGGTRQRSISHSAEVGVGIGIGVGE